MFCRSNVVRELFVGVIVSVGATIYIPSPAYAADVAASAPGTALPAGVAAIVNGVAIPASELDAAIQATRQPDKPQLREQLKQQLVLRELFRQNAEKAHYDTNPEVRKAMQVAQVNAETQLYLKDSIHPEAVTDAHIKARYEAIVASLGKEEYKPRIIAVPDAATAATVLAELKAGKPFDLLARQYSTAPTRDAGGEMPWMSFPTPVKEGKTGGLPISIAQALVDLPVGGVASESVSVGQGGSAARVIVKLDAKRPTQVPAFEQAKVIIGQQLQAVALEKAAAQFSANLLKGANVQE